MKFLKYALVFVIICTSIFVLSACGTPTTGKAVGNVTNKQIEKINSVIQKLDTVNQQDIIIEQISPLLKNDNQAIISNSNNSNYLLSSAVNTQNNSKKYLPQKIGETINKNNTETIKKININN